jgi:hypothetical protein
MRLTNAELLTLRAVENRKLVQKAYDSGHMQSCDEEKIDSENRVPGDFYWHEDWQPPPLRRRILMALKHMLGMKI